MINTLIIYFLDVFRIKRLFRAILDNSSEFSLLTAKATDVLNLKEEKKNVLTTGLNNSALNAKYKITAILSYKDTSKWT